MKDYSMDDGLISKYLSVNSKKIKSDNGIDIAIQKLNEKNNTEAIVLFDKILEKDKDLIQLNYGKAIAFARMGKKIDAIKLLKNLLDKIPEGHANAIILLDALKTDLIENIQKMFENKEYNKVFKLMNEAKATKIAIENLDYYRASFFLENNNVDSARVSLSEELRYFPDNKKAKNLLNSINENYPVKIFEGASDPDFMEIVHKIKPYTMVGDRRLYSLYCIARKICEENIPGNFVECGVAGGGTTALLALVVKKFSRQIRWVYSFDSFDGMPTPDSEDIHNGIFAEDTGWGTGTCSASEENVIKLCQNLGISEIVQTVKGYFQDTLPLMKNRSGIISLLHMDGDWYDSTKTILKYLYERVVNDGFIQIDDYGYWEGCKKAVIEFETQNNLKFFINQIDGTGVWLRVNENFPVNRDISTSIIETFKQDDIVREGVLSQMSRNERFQHFYLLNNFFEPKNNKLRFIEIGSFSGASLLLTCNTLFRKKINFEGFSIEPEGTPQFYQIISKLTSNISHLKAFSYEVVNYLYNYFSIDGNFPEFIFIDGDHTYEGVYKDIENYYPLLKPGGIMMFHDYLPPLNSENSEAIFFHHGGTEPGIRKACEELMVIKYHCQLVELPLLYPTDPEQTQAHLPIIPGVFSTVKAYRKPVKFN